MPRSRRSTPPFLVLALLALPATGLDLPEGAERAATAIDERSILGTVRFLSSDLLEGRGPGSRGDLLTRAYLASELEQAGFEPGAPDGSWEQPFEIVGLTSEAPATWSFSTKGGPVGLTWSEDWIAVTGVQSEHAAIDGAEVVFVGYGIEAPEYGWDDFEGADLRGKVLLMLNNDPDWSDDLFEGSRRLYYGRWTYKYESAARQGAVGAIIVHTTPSAGYPWQVVQTSWTGEQFQLPAGDEPRLQVESWVTDPAAKRLLAAAGHDLDALTESARSRDFRPVPLGITTSLALTNRVASTETANVIGKLTGSDPDIAKQAIVYTAHHDHLGVGQPDEDGDAIYNGALDNALGTAQVLAMARAFAHLPERPRRTVYVAFVAAEEQGLLGSEFFSQNPPVPAGRIAANLNFDAGNAFGRTRDITYIGYGKSSLDRVIEEAAARQGRVVKGDQFPDRGSFYRSDQFNFAKIGVPALYLDGGTEFVGKDPEFGRQKAEEYESTCYHQPCDEIHDDWDLSGLVEDATLGFWAGLAIANADEMPAWNPGDEFEAARKAAITAAGD